MPMHWYIGKTEVWRKKEAGDRHYFDMLFEPLDQNWVLKFQKQTPIKVTEGAGMRTLTTDFLWIITNWLYAYKVGGYGDRTGLEPPATLRKSDLWAFEQEAQTKIFKDHWDEVKECVMELTQNLVGLQVHANW